VIRLRGIVNASGDGITLTVAASGILGHPLRVKGVAPAGSSGAEIAIESARPGRDGWTQVAGATVAANGSFSARWTPAAGGQVALRAVMVPQSAASTGSSGSSGLSGSASAAAGVLGTSPLMIPIFTDAVATMYGPGFWGHHTACGERLTHATIGVASRTLKCGTQVAIFYRGHELTVPVIDRGPYGSRASWDLTMATARALGIRQTVTVGTLTSADAVAARS
jgi:hypothetical protein